MKRLGIGKQEFFGSDHANATTHHMTKNGASIWLITIRPFNRRERTREQFAGLIAHEAMHVIQGMQREYANGETLGCEAEAYLMQQIVQECLQDAWASNMERRTVPSR